MKAITQSSAPLNKYDHHNMQQKKHQHAEFPLNGTILQDIFSYS